MSDTGRNFLEDAALHSNKGGKEEEDRGEGEEEKLKKKVTQLHSIPG